MKGIRIITTYKCNIMCSNCSYGCTPSKRGIMNPSKFKEEVFSAYNEGFRDFLIIDGGEPFLYASQMYKYLKKIRELEIKKYITTNGYWGDMDTFLGILHELKKLGLDGIIIEYDSYHLVYLDKETIEKAVEKVVLSNLEVHIRASFNTDGLKDEMDIKTFELIKKIKESCGISSFIFERTEKINKNNRLYNSLNNNEKRIFL